MYEYVGALHIHSVFSDGSGEIPDIALHADESGLDFILISDHNTLRGLEEGYEKWYGKTLVLIGCEINDRKNQNHYLAFGLNKTLSTRLPAKEYVTKVNDNGGFGFIAHPHEKRSSMAEHPPYPWTEWDCEDYTGIEIWNHMSEWMEGLTEQNKFNYFIHPLKSIIAPPQETLKVWDEVSMKRKVVGVGGVDAHAHKVNMLGFFEVEVFPYKVLFKSIRTHILTGEKIAISDSKEMENSKRIIYGALREGRCFVSNYYHGDASSFRFYAKRGETEYQMGDSFPFSSDISLKVEVPENGAVIKLFKNGSKTKEIQGTKAAFEADTPGIYRVEVYLNNNAWIFSNHIRIQ
jgi:hypothetical protein